jgi:hypothetical protein
MMQARALDGCRHARDGEGEPVTPRGGHRLAGLVGLACAGYGALPGRGPGARAAAWRLAR